MVSQRTATRIKRSECKRTATDSLSSLDHDGTHTVRIRDELSERHGVRSRRSADRADDGDAGAEQRRRICVRGRRYDEASEVLHPRCGGWHVLCEREATQARERTGRSPAGGVRSGCGGGRRAGGRLRGRACAQARRDDLCARRSRASREDGRGAQGSFRGHRPRVPNPDAPVRLRRKLGDDCARLERLGPHDAIGCGEVVQREAAGGPGNGADQVPAA